MKSQRMEGGGVGRRHRSDLTSTTSSSPKRRHTKEAKKEKCGSRRLLWRGGTGVEGTWERQFDDRGMV